ncbi:nodulation protein NfeD [Streptomyces sp. NPDC057438]|uniref:NfeD family protein n=1 Tax=Streptomyces sp. NPDC057438 TaxID=3346133 RepID=UPI0036C44455
MADCRPRTMAGIFARALLVSLACLLGLPAAGAAQDSRVLVTQVDGTITPVIADHLEEGLRTAERDGYAAYVVEIDTPGGLLVSTREIVQDFLSSSVPVVVYVTPSGAGAASAGVYITMSAHIAAMAPGTHIGAGTPVTGEGEEASDKVVNDSAAFAVSIAERRDRNTQFAESMVRDGTSIADQQALRDNVVDLVTPSTDALLDDLDGRTVVVGPHDATREVELHTANARVVQHDLGFFGDLRQWLASPELAFLFLSIGTLAVLYELAAPGVGFAGVVGGILLVLGFVALSVLPFNVGGLLLLLLAAGLFAGEVLTPGVGVFAAGGTASLVMAGILLFRGELRVDPAVLWPISLVVGGGVLIAGHLAWRARRAPTLGDEDELVGREAVVTRIEGGAGQVRLDGVWWTVRGRDAPVVEGRRVRVVAREGLDLIVEDAPHPGEDRGPTEEET